MRVLTFCTRSDFDVSGSCSYRNRTSCLQTDIPLAALQTAIRVAASCVETDPKRRPRMADVVRTLGAALEVRDFLRLIAPFLHQSVQILVEKQD